MKKRLQGFITGALIGTMLTSGMVFAKSGTEIIEALYNNIKIYVDGTANQNLELRIYLDNDLIKIIKLKYNQMPSAYNINLNGALQLKIEAVNPEGDTWAQATYGIANAVIE